MRFCENDHYHEKRQRQYELSLKGWWIAFEIAFPFVEHLWKISTIYFQARSVSKHSKMRGHVAETADIAVGIEYYTLRNTCVFSFI